MPGKRRSRKYEGSTYNLVEVRPGEYQPRCKSCGTVVPARIWWEHKCPEVRLDELSKSTDESK